MVSDNTKEKTIPAEAHTDDFQVSVSFDALKWFQQASDQEITDLADCDWRGDYPADEVATTSAQWDPSINQIFEHKSADKNLCGFECSVDDLAAMDWLKDFKGTLHAKIKEDADTSPNAS